MNGPKFPQDDDNLRLALIDETQPDEEDPSPANRNYPSSPLPPTPTMEFNRLLSSTGQTPTPQKSSPTLRENMNKALLGCIPPLPSKTPSPKSSPTPASPAEEEKTIRTPAIPRPEIIQKKTAELEEQGFRWPMELSFVDETLQSATLLHPGNEIKLFLCQEDSPNEPIGIVVETTNERPGVPLDPQVPHTIHIMPAPDSQTVDVRLTGPTGLRDFALNPNNQRNKKTRISASNLRLETFLLTGEKSGDPQILRVSIQNLSFPQSPTSKMYVFRIWAKPHFDQLKAQNTPINPNNPSNA